MCRCGSVYQDWGWGTADGAQALTYLKKFGSVTVLNGHIHQVMQKVEGHVAFHTARSTAFPQPAPGTAKGPGPMAVPAGELKHLPRHRQGQPGGVERAARHRRHAAGRLRRLAMRNELAPGGIARRGMLRAALRLAAAWSCCSARRCGWRRRTRRRSVIDNFKFAPTPLTVPKGATVTWVNHDDMPHSIVVPGAGVSFEADGHRRQRQPALRSAGHVRLCLRAASVHARQDRGSEVIYQKRPAGIRRRSRL